MAREAEREAAHARALAAARQPLEPPVAGESCPIIGILRAAA